MLRRVSSYLESCPLYTNKNINKFLFFTGAAWLSTKILGFLKDSLSLLFTFEKNLLQRYGPGSYALITGASDGIGKCFALKLAKRGFNIVLVARNQTKLEAVKAEILKEYPKTDVRIIIADFSQCLQENFFQDIIKQVEDLDISILVNNVGIRHLNIITKLYEKQIKEEIIVNCIPQAILTKLFVERMKKRKHRSCIIALSSITIIHPIPYSSIYGSTKAFNDYLSRTMSKEHPEIDFYSLKPGYVSTKMISYKDASGFVTTQEACVESALRELGHKQHSHGNWRHKLLSNIALSLPMFVRDKIFLNLMETEFRESHMNLGRNLAE